MAVFHKLVAFDRPLSGVSIPGSGGRMYTEAEISAERNKAYQDGSNAARGFADQQLVEFRAEVQALQDGLFRKLEHVEADVLVQLRASLPVLVVDLARRLLAGFEPNAEQVLALCTETLSQVFPEHEDLELYISPRDSELLDTLSPEWKRRYPGLKIVADATLGAGDCQVRSRFGLTDARKQAKLDAMSRELLNA